MSKLDTSVTASILKAKPRGLILEIRCAEMKTSLILITLRHLRIDCRAHFCRDCRKDYHGYCEERDRCFIYSAIHAYSVSINDAKVRSWSTGRTPAEPPISNLKFQI